MAEKVIWQTSESRVVFIEDGDNSDANVLQSAAIDSGIPVDDLVVKSDATTEQKDAWRTAMTYGTWYGDEL